MLQSSFSMLLPISVWSVSLKNGLNVLHPHIAPKNGCKKEQADSSMSSRPTRVSHKSAPHVVIIWFAVPTKDINLSGLVNVPAFGQRSQFSGVSDRVTNSSIVGRPPVRLVEMPVATIDGCIVVVEDGAGEGMPVAIIDGCTEVVEDGAGDSAIETSLSILGAKVDAVISVVGAIEGTSVEAIVGSTVSTASAVADTHPPQ